MTCWRTTSGGSSAETTVWRSPSSGPRRVVRCAESRGAPPQPCGTTATCICKSLLPSPVERIKARPDAHPMMPRDRECPRHQGTKNGLKDSERENVAFAGEEPGHRGPANPRNRNQHRIGPMKRPEDGAGDERGAGRTIRCGEKTVC